MNFKLQIIDKSSKLYIIHDLFDWLLQYIKFIKLIVHFMLFVSGDITVYSFHRATI